MQCLAREILGNFGLRACLGRGDDIAPDEVGQVLVERLHAYAIAGLDTGVHLRNLGLADQVADRARSQHDFVRRDAPLAILGLAQGLGDDRLQGFGQHGTNHFLFFGGEDVDDPVDGLGGAGGMQRAEHQMPCLGGGHGQADRFEVAHFANEDGVGVFAQGGFERSGKAHRVRADFALVDQALFGIVYEFDGVFDREDVAVFVFIEVVHHRRQGGGLARPRRACNQDQPARAQRQLGKDLGAVELFEREDLAGNRPKHRACPPVLVEGVDPEPRQPFDFEREVDFHVFLVGLALRVVHDVVDHRVDLLMVQQVDIDSAHVAMYADHGRQPGGQVQVRSLVLDAECQQLRNVHAFSHRGWLRRGIIWRDYDSWMETRLLDLLVCPVTKGPLEYRRETQELVSRSAKLAYPVRDGIPILLESSARALREEESAPSKRPESLP